ncbi:hypothetical protein EV426DRAFT_644492 [Tirmania nivea]|nr:hypothetical protein EV426DRAFT_644492 [Tirmania nivea]
MLRAFLRPPTQHVRRGTCPNLSFRRTLLTRCPVVGGGHGRRDTRLEIRNSYANWIHFENGWEGRITKLQFAIPWKRWISTEKDTSTKSEFSCEDIVIGHGRSGAVMGVRVFRPPPRAKSAPEVPLMIFYPSGLPVFIPPDSHNEGGIGPLLITENDHTIAAILAVSSNHTVVVPGYFVGSKHIIEQLYPKKKGDGDEESGLIQKEAEEKNKEVVKGTEGDYSDGFEEDYGEIGDFVGNAVHDVEAAKSGLDIDGGSADAATGGAVEGVENRSDGSGWVYPYPKHPIAGHLALRAYEYILQNLSILLNLPPNRIPPEVSLSMSGSLVGAGLASSIALSEFKHPPFTTGVRVETTTLVPSFRLKKRTEKVTINVELKSLALVTPLINWCFEPLGGYDFSADQQGTGEGWLLPPVPPLPHPAEAADTEPEGGSYFLPAPTLPTLLRLRSAYFKSPEDYIDPFASPLFFMQTPGLDVGKDALARLWVSLRQQRWLDGAVERVRALRAGKKVEKPKGIDIITIEGTKRKSVWRRWPPAWGKLQVDGIAECRRGGLPRKGRIRVIIPGEGEDEGGSEVVWRDENAEKEGAPPERKPLDLTPATNWPSEPSPPLIPLSFPGTFPDPRAVIDPHKPYIIAESAEYAQDHTPVDKYTHSTNTISLLKNPSRLLSRITSPPLSTRSAGWWLVSQAGDFVGGIDRSWRSVVSADRNLRRKLEIEKEEKEKQRLKKRQKIMGTRGFLVSGRKGEEVVDEGEAVKVWEKEEVVDEEALSLLEVIGGSEGVDEKRKENIEQRMVLEKDAVVRLGKWVAEVEKLP